MKKIFLICIVSIIGIFALFIIIKYTSFNEQNTYSTFNELSKKEADVNKNNIWVGSFQLAWNEFMDKVVGKNIQFEHGNTELVNELNKKSFTKDMLSENSYYINVDKATPQLKTTILNDIKNKFNIENTTLLNNMNFDSQSDSYVIYSILFKNLNFYMPFDKLKSPITFGDDKTNSGGVQSVGLDNKNNKIQYFGINNESSEELNNNVDVMFYNNKSDFAVKLKTKENDEVLLYRTDSSDNFDEVYGEIEEKEKNYTGSKKFEKLDLLEIPYVFVNTTINYDELCNKSIKDKNGMYISSASQNITFSLNEKGVNLTSESGLKSEVLSSNISRNFCFDNNFVLFLKEKDKSKFYFALKVNSTENLL